MYLRAFYRTNAAPPGFIRIIFAIPSRPRDRTAEAGAVPPACG